MLTDFRESERNDTEAVSAPSAGGLSADHSAWDYRSRFKRWFDVAFSIAVLPLVIPLGVVVALLIRLDSPGPILIRVRRLGRSGSTFKKYKFRTMVPDAELVLQQLLAS